MPVMTGGQALVQQLKMEGIDTIFGLPGVQLDWAFDALYDERDNFSVIHTRHEQATAYMADGYARSTGRVGTCLVVPGPGLLNASAALATAYGCSSPVLCISGQIDSSLIGLGRGILHEVKEQMEAIASVTKWQGRALTPAEVPGLVHRAFRAAQPWAAAAGRDRGAAGRFAGHRRSPALGASRDGRAAGDPDLIEKAAQALGRAKSPLIFAGGGVIRAGAWDELQQLAEMLEAPVVDDRERPRRPIRPPSSCDSPTSLAGDLAPTPDVILAVGSRFVVGASVSWQPGEQDGHPARRRPGGNRPQLRA